MNTEMEPWYAQAERLFGVHGQAGDDPTEPPRSGAYPHPPIPHAPIPHAPLIASLADKLRAQGLKPFHMPAAIDLQEDRQGGAFPCRLDAKGDAEICLLNPALRDPDISLHPGCEVKRLVTDASGARIVAAEVEPHGRLLTVRADRFVLSAGAINSALLLQRSASERLPDGLANASGQVGRNDMNHNTSGLMGLLRLTVNRTRYPKTLALNGHYPHGPDGGVALGNIQMLGNIPGPMVRAAVRAGRAVAPMRHWCVSAKTRPRRRSIRGAGPGSTTTCLSSTRVSFRRRVR